MKNDKIQIRISKEKKESFKELLKKLNLTISEFITNCIDKELKIETR